MELIQDAIRVRPSQQKSSDTLPLPVSPASSLDMTPIDDEFGEDLEEEDPPRTLAPKDAPTPTAQQNVAIDSGEGGSPVRQCQILRVSITVFYTTGFSLQSQTRLQKLLALAEFQQAATFRDQGAIACPHFHAFKDGQRFSWQEIEMFMGNVSASSIRSQWQKAQRKPKAIGRPRVISNAVYEIKSNARGPSDR
jgi:hypothetical protein